MKCNSAIIFLAASVAFGQTPAKERDTLQALLDEVHQLRQSIEGMTAASQRVQIALYGLQLQDAAVTRATQRADNTHNKCTSAETSRQQISADVQRLETGLVLAGVPDNEVRSVRERLGGMKGMLDAQNADVQSCKTAEAEAAAQLRNEQAKLTELQDRIARLDRALAQLGVTAK